MNAWRDGVVASDGRSQALVRWILPLVVNGLTWTLIVKLWHELGRLPVVVPVGLAFFALLGIVLLFYALRATLRFSRDGQMFLRMTPFPARLGQRVRVTSTVPAHYGQDSLRVSLACQRGLPQRQERVLQFEELWQQVHRRTPQVGAQGPLLAGEFDLPLDQPASDWSTAEAQVSWIVRIESEDGALDRSFVVPVLAAEAGALHRAAPTSARPAEDSRLADAYVERRGDTWVIDSRGQIGARRGHRAGAVMLVVGLLCFVFPLLWLYMPSRGGGVASALSLGIGLLLLLPTLLGAGLAFGGVAMLGKRLRTELAGGRLSVEDGNWLWLARTTVPAGAVQHIEAKHWLRMQDSKRSDGVFALTAQLANGRKLDVAWGLRDAASAAALADTLLRACRESGGAPPMGLAWRRRYRPALPLLALGVLLPLTWQVLPLALTYPLRLENWDGRADDHARVAWLATQARAPGFGAELLGERNALRWPPAWLSARWIGDARARLAARRPAPTEAGVQLVPRAPAPRIDGRLDDDEWRGALVLPLQAPDVGSSARILSDGEYLYFGADVPADTTEEGFDQFRVWYHLDLSPAFANERVFLGRHGDLSALRGLNSDAAAARRGGQLTQWLQFTASHGATRVAGHRQYELALNLVEAGLAVEAPFNLWIEIEGDPLRNADGKFKARTSLGEVGSHQHPGWYRIAPVQR